jgi:hypothetical protein
MNSLHQLPDILSAIISFMFRAYREGSNTKISAHQIYELTGGYPEWIVKTPPEHVDGIIAAFEKLNQRWPGFLTPVHPPKPEPEDRMTILWIMNPSVIWQQGNWFITPTMEEVYRVAGASW